MGFGVILERTDCKSGAVVLRKIEHQLIYKLGLTMGWCSGDDSELSLHHCVKSIDIPESCAESPDDTFMIHLHHLLAERFNLIHSGDGPWLSFFYALYEEVLTSFNKASLASLQSSGHTIL